jgi:hypothetical protein
MVAVAEVDSMVASAVASARASAQADAERLEQQLASARSQLQQAESENGSLRTQLAQATGGASSATSVFNTSAASAGFGGASAQAGSVSVPRADLLELERQLRDKTAQVLLMRSRYDHLEAKGAAERDLYDRAVNALDDQNRALRETRAALQAAENDVGLLRAKLSGTFDLEEQVRKKTDEVRRLEATINDLAESPFLGNPKGLLEQKRRLEQLEISDRALREQIAHLQQAVKAQHLDIQAARRDRVEAQEAAGRARGDADRERGEREAVTRANTLLRERLALYSGAAALDGVGAIMGDTLSVPPEELEKALAIVRRRLDRPSSSTGTVGGSEDLSASLLVAPLGPEDKKKVQQLQLALLSSQRELERCERMLKAQTALAKDMGVEVQELQARLTAEGSGLKTRIAELESLAEQRLQKANMLEAQVRQLLAARTSAAATARKRETLLATARATTGFLGTAATARPAAGTTKAPKREADEDASTVISDITDEEGRGAAGHSADELGLDLDDVHGSPRRTVRPGIGAAEDGDLEDSVGASELSASILSDMSVDFGPGENVIEVYIKAASLDPALFKPISMKQVKESEQLMYASGHPNAVFDTTFAMVDFYHFATQTSPLATGTHPKYNFAASFRVPMDPHFLRYAGAEGVSIDLNQARGADFTMLARANLPLHRLLLGPSASDAAASPLGRIRVSSDGTRILYPSLPLRSREGRVVGSLDIEARVALPLLEAWKGFCRDRPQEGAALTSAIMTRMQAEAEGVPMLPSTGTIGPSSGPAGGDADFGDPSTAVQGTGTLANSSKPRPNELIVTTIAASGLRPRSRMPGVQPSCYVQFTIPGMRTAFSPVVRHSANPTFADARAFAIVPSSRTLTMLQETPLQIVVCDDDAPFDTASASSMNERAVLSTIHGPIAATAAPLSSGARAGLSMFSHRHVLGVATVSLARAAEGLDTEGQFDLVDPTNGAPAGKLSLRINWARPLVSVDGNPPDSLSRDQVHALCSVFDRDGAGVKHALLARLCALPFADLQAIERLRECILKHLRDSRVAVMSQGASQAAAAALMAATGRRQQRIWTEGLQTAAEATGRPGGRLTPREVYEALTLPSVGVQVDLPSVEDAILALLPEGESSVLVSDLCDVLTPLSTAASIALAKTRRFVREKALGLGKNTADEFASRGDKDFDTDTAVSKVLAILNDAAQKKDDGASTMGGRGMSTLPRIPRSAVVRALRDLGMIVIDDSLAPAAAATIREARFANSTMHRPAPLDAETARRMPGVMDEEEVLEATGAFRGTVNRGGSVEVLAGAFQRHTQENQMQQTTQAPGTATGRGTNAKELVFDLFAAAERLSSSNVFGQTSGMRQSQAQMSATAAPAPAPAPAPALAPVPAATMALTDAPNKANGPSTDRQQARRASVSSTSGADRENVGSDAAAPAKQADNGRRGSLSAPVPQSVVSYAGRPGSAELGVTGLTIEVVNVTRPRPAFLDALSQALTTDRAQAALYLTYCVPSLSVAIPGDSTGVRRAAVTLVCPLTSALIAKRNKMVLAFGVWNGPEKDAPTTRPAFGVSTSK